jgi:hypothetical protein
MPPAGPTPRSMEAAAAEHDAIDSADIHMLPVHDGPPALDDAAVAATSGIDEHGRPIPDLPTSHAGSPKPAAAWIAGIVYWIGSQPDLQARTGLAVTPAVAAADAASAQRLPACFVRQPLTGTDPEGVLIASLVRRVLRECGSGIKLAGWDAVRKQLSGDRPNPSDHPPADCRKKWWANPHRGGNERGDHSQTYFVRTAPPPPLTATVTSASCARVSCISNNTDCQRAIGVLCCAVLCCAVLCCAVLCCAVLCCAVLSCAVLCCAVLCCAVLCCAVLCCAVLCCAVLCCV